MSHPTSVYRLYDQAGQLLYVGIAGNPGRRFEQHRGDKPWWGDVDHIRLEHYPTRETASVAELHAIRTEDPRYNIAGRGAQLGAVVELDSRTAADSTLPYPSSVRWSFQGLRHGMHRTMALRLVYEINRDPISDDYYPDEISPSGLWRKWLDGTNWTRYPDGRVPVHWFVAGDEAFFEAAPFTNAPGGDFLSYFTWPRRSDDQLEALNWARLPVTDKRWTADHGDKGGFIQQLTGWKPAPFQTHFDTRLIARAARLPGPPEDPR